MQFKTTTYGTFNTKRGVMAQDGREVVSGVEGSWFDSEVLLETEPLT